MKNLPEEDLISALIVNSPRDIINDKISKLKDINRLLSLVVSENMGPLMISFQCTCSDEPYDYIDGEYFYFRSTSASKRYSICEYQKYVLDCFLDAPQRVYDFDILCQYAEENDEYVNSIDNEIRDSLFEQDYIPSIDTITYYSKEAISYAVDYINEEMTHEIPIHEFLDNIIAISRNDTEVMEAFSWYDEFVSEYKSKFLYTMYVEDHSSRIFSHQSLSDRLDAWNEDNRDWVPSRKKEWMENKLSDLGVGQAVLIPYHISKMSQDYFMEKFGIKGPVHKNGLILVQP